MTSKSYVAKSGHRLWHLGEARAAVGCLAVLITMATPVSLFAQTYDVEVPLPASVDIRDVVLGASDYTLIDAYSDVEGGGHSRVVNMGTGSESATLIAWGAKTGDVLSVPDVTIAVSQITGSVQAEGAVFRAPGTTVTGTVTQHAAIGRSTGPVIHVEFPTTSNGSVAIWPTQTRELSPGRYTNLNVSPGATLRLKSGVYYVDKYLVSPLATVIVDESNGEVELYVRTAMQHMGTYKQPTGSIPPNLFTAFFGTTPAYVGAGFPGTVIAPNAQLIIGTFLGHSTHVGAFFAKSIKLLPFTTIKHRASDHFGIGGNAVIPRTNGNVPTSSNGKPNITGTFTPTGPDPNDGYWDDLTLVPPDPALGVFPPRYCDANDNPVPAPTEEELNAPPAPGSTCPAVAANTSTCPVDPASVTTLCTTDSDCASGMLCAARCLNAECTEIEHRCGKQASSCAGLPAEDNCEEYRLCPENGAVGTVDQAKFEAQSSPTTALSKAAIIQPDEKTQIAPTYQSPTGALCTGPIEKTVNKQDGSSKPAGDHEPKTWGFYSEPISGFGAEPVLSSQGIAELKGLHGEIGYDVGGYVFKNKLSVLSVSVKAVVDDCGLTGVATVKFLGEAIAAITPKQASLLNLHVDLNNQAVTSLTKGKACRDARMRAKTAILETRKSFLYAKEIEQYYRTSGMTPQLCRQIQIDLGSDARKDASGEPYDCTETTPKVAKIDILNAWAEEYEKKSADYLDYEKGLGLAQKDVSVSGTITVFDKAPKHPYSQEFFNQTWPVGPVAITLAIEGFGAWGVAGGIQLGLGVDGKFNKDLLKGASPRIGDIRAYAGPVVTPSISTGILLFAGVGYPGISIGLEGKITFVDFALPSGATVAVMKVSSDDLRDRSSSEYSGPIKQGFTPTAYQWVMGVNWRSSLTATALAGQLDLAARVRLLFYKKTFRFKLFDWEGLKFNKTLVAGELGDALSFSGDHGYQAEDLAYTDVSTYGDVNESPAGPQFPGCDVIIH